MIELAGKDPTEPKTQVAQLLALRWLGAHPEEAKKSDKARALLEQIAQGKKAQDSYGFARGYAQRALARIEGKPAPARPAIPTDSLRSDAFKWFPADVMLLGGIDMRASGETRPADEDLAAAISRVVPQKEILAFADQVGNLRLDRVALALSANVRGMPDQGYARVSGTGNLKRLAEFARKNTPEGKLTESKGPKGEAITVLSGRDRNLAIAFIGDTDLLMPIMGNLRCLPARRWKCSWTCWPARNPTPPPAHSRICSRRFQSRPMGWWSSNCPRALASR